MSIFLMSFIIKHWATVYGEVAGAIEGDDVCVTAPNTQKITRLVLPRFVRFYQNRAFESHICTLRWELQPTSQVAPPFTRVSDAWIAATIFF